MSRRPRALVALEDGTVFRGVGFGARVTSTGEVCFNTGMTGYQEVLTDPSYCGQIVAMTAPQVGNTGVNRADEQSRRPWVAGFVVRELSPVASSWRSEGDLDTYLGRLGIAGVAEVDTRRLARHLRARGAMKGALSTLVIDADELVDVARSAPPYGGRDLVAAVTTRRPYRWEPARATRARWRVAAFDFGIKRNLLELLAAFGCRVTVLPATTSAATVLDGRYDGVFLSNGPGDPEPLTYAVETVRSLLARVPLFGICLGHQVLALALGARTFKLRFGHRGANHPVRWTAGRRVEITSQNHGYAVDEASLAGTAARLTHVNLNDRTVEGLEVPGLAFGVQYHPEAGPGPHDSRYLFERFVALMTSFRPSATRMTSVAKA